ncbi:MAG: hypothetical protein GY859_19270 [Desulfobacterales bacterium]|nr:hypothetical protein [Desulfobacterales bacterium]
MQPALNGQGREPISARGVGVRFGFEESPCSIRVVHGIEFTRFATRVPGSRRPPITRGTFTVQKRLSRD